MFNIHVTLRDIVGNKSVTVIMFIHVVCQKIFLTDDKLSLCFLNFQQLLKDKRETKTNTYLLSINLPEVIYAKVDGAVTVRLLL